MKLPRTHHLISSIVLSTSLTFSVACGGGGGGGGNLSPTVNAGLDQHINEQSEVTLSGSGIDPDGFTLSFQWIQTAGTSVRLTLSTSRNASFIAPTLTSPETLSFNLVVTDSDGATASDSVNINVNPINYAPTADAGNDQRVYKQSPVTLLGSGIDTDGSIVGYQWTQLSGTSVALDSVNSASTNFTAPEVDSEEILEFKLTVTDNEGGSDFDTVSINVAANVIPVANAGIGQFVTSGATVTLDASASIDPAGGGLSYAWLQTDIISVIITLNDNTVLQPTFTAPDLTAVETFIFELTITDRNASTDTAFVNIAIKPVITEKLNDTGVTLCSGNDGHSETCADVTDTNGDPIPDGQDGDFGRDVTANDSADGANGFSFTKLDGDSNPLLALAAEWSCVKDNVTGLIWEVKTIDGGLHDKNNSYTWYNSNASSNGGNNGWENAGICSNGDCDTEKYVAEVNAEGLCAASNWRLPTREELRSIVDYSIHSSLWPTVDTNYFLNAATVKYWTSSSDARSNFYAKVIDFDNGESTNMQKSSGNIYIRLVHTDNN